MEQVFSDDRTRSLETVDVFITRVDPKDTSKLIKAASQQYPLENLGHLRRVKRIQTGTDVSLLFLLSTISSTTQDDLEQFLAAKSVSHGPITVAQVSRYAAITRKQFNEWKTLWPMSYHDCIVREDPPLSPEEVASAEKWMRLALQVAAPNAGSADDSFINGAIMVDPVTNTQISASGDDRRKNPLHHATMNCIEQVAQRERKRRQSRHAPDRKIDTDRSVDVKQSQPRSHTDPPNHKRKAADDDDALEDEAIAYAGKSGYLCTNLDLYVVREPCAMCSMALVHSRIGRVFYAVSQAQGGVGTAYKIHLHPSLNHHYKAFRGLCTQEASIVVER